METKLQFWNSLSIEDYSEHRATLIANGQEFELIIWTNSIDHDGIRDEIKKDPRYSDFNQYSINDNDFIADDKYDKQAIAAIAEHRDFIQSEINARNKQELEDAITLAIDMEGQE